jgi:DNA-binding NtrC family response regulator
MNREKQTARRALGVQRTGTGDGCISKGRKERVNLGLSYDRQSRASALLVYAAFEPLHTLRVALASQGFDTWRARSCRQALSFLANFRPVHVIFTDMSLPDGTWLDLARAKRRTSAPLIVVARKMDARLWSDILQHGGGGLMVPPFAASDLIYAVRRSRASRWSNQGLPQDGNFELPRDDAERCLARWSNGALGVKG